MFLGFSDCHSSQVPLVLNIITGKISPQYHVIFDDKFETVHSLSKDASVEQQWRNVLKLGYECFLDTDFDGDGNPILPTYGDLIKDYITAKSKREFTEPSGLHREPAFDDYGHHDHHQVFDGYGTHDDHQDIQPVFPPHLPTLDVDTLHGTQAPGGDNPIANGDHSGNETVAATEARPRRNVGTYKDGPAKIRRLPIDGKEYEFAFNVNVISHWEQPVPAVLNSRHVPKSFHAQHKLQKGYLAECYLLQDSWFEDPTCVSELSDHIRMDPWDGSDNIYFNDIVDPRILAARMVPTKKSKYNDDNLSFDTATRGPFQAEFWQAMRVELNTLINEFDCWDYVPNPGKNVLQSTWAFKIK